ncbi:hypothetical protein [Tropicimonas sp. IMCC6043]|uniref:hypothetical protein n=1 Tax=Tropicimonas sp. IMCC6043 TaxID=2510645 RepID=UPI00101C0E0C|nr:hypothetical protein [Tropicimonas sp. IMCC6043]RYH10084.1 hypothetical protein EU800_09350 [Tropicimonas sp. IMCC6043]
MRHVAAIALVVLLHSPAAAQNLAPELMIDGTCSDKVAWASRPVAEIEADLNTRLGTESAAQMQPNMVKTVMGILRTTPVSDSWFAGRCEFTEDQLAAMAPLHEAYVNHMAAKLGE